jgi:hypothetical protein
MLLVFALCALAGLACGLLIPHWLGLGSVCIGMTALLLIATPWDLLLPAKWLTSLLALQLAWLGGSSIRLRLGPLIAPRHRLGSNCSKRNVPSA